MIKIMEKHTIITLKNQGHSNRKISRDTGINRKTIARYWNAYVDQQNRLGESLDKRTLQEEITGAPKYNTSSRKPRKYTEEIDCLVEKIMMDEKEKCRLLGTHHKQNLTSIQIHELVVAAGHDIGRSTISEQVRAKRNRHKESFIRQDYEYADRLEYDFGEVRLIIGNQPYTYYLAVFSSPASNARWAYLYKNQTKEVFMDSHVKFFEMVEGVYKEVVYDNMKNVVTRFIGPSEKILNEDLIKMSLYYGFNINVTNCYSGNEKGHVEGSVKIIRNKVFAKKYEFHTLKEAEEYLFQQIAKMNEKSSFSEEKQRLKPYKPPLELATIAVQKVDKYSFIRVDNNFYSVPEYLVAKDVTIKKYLAEIMVFAGNELVCRHKKIDGCHEMVVDIYHYLDTFQKKPGALKNSLALKSKMELKAIYDKHFTTRTKEFIAVLKENPEKRMHELLEVLKAKAFDTSIYKSSHASEMEDHIKKHTQAQICEVSRLYGLGGGNLVH